jgi:hypothetical protein
MWKGVSHPVAGEGVPANTRIDDDHPAHIFG